MFLNKLDENLNQILKKITLLYGHLGQSKPYATSVITDSKTGYGVVFLCNTDCYKLRTEIPYMIFDMLENQ